MQHNRERGREGKNRDLGSKRGVRKVRNLRRGLSMTWIPLLLVCLILYWCRRYDQTQCESAFRVPAHAAAVQLHSPGVSLQGVVILPPDFKVMHSLDNALEASTSRGPYPRSSVWCSIFKSVVLNEYQIKVRCSCKQRLVERAAWRCDS